jgi:hypothetical protein
LRIALVVGINHYQDSMLKGCINDAQEINKVLSINDDLSPNFSTKLLVSSDEPITRSVLRENIDHLFSCDAEIAVLYFAGHGTINNLGGYLVTQDAKRYDEGVSMVDVLTMANQSRSREVVIILDCCHSGALGALPAIANDKAHLREGVSVLCASRPYEYALERGGYGLFSALVCEALYGGASNLLGIVTVADVYAFVDRNLKPWDQRPLFKCHVSTLAPLRKCDPTIDLSVLRLLPNYFQSPDYEFPLNPSYEPSSDYRDPENEEIFGVLKAYRAAGLLVPIDEVHMYFAAMHSKSCKLTKLGKYYWHLAKARRI